MKVYSFGAENAPAILLLPGTCCHWRGNFGRVIPLLSDRYRVLCVSYDGFDETEHTEFPTMPEETEKIEAYIQKHCGGHIRAGYGCSLGGSFVGLLAARQNIHMDYGILGSSDLDQASPLAAKLQTNLLLLLIGAEDDALWDTAKYIRRMEKRLAEKPHECEIETMVYAHGTHFVFPEGMLKTMLPVGSGLFVQLAFQAAKKYPKECRQTRIDIEKRMCRTLAEWKGEK